LPAAPLAKTQYPIVVGDERTSLFDRSGDQQPIGGIPVFEVMELIAAARRAMAERQGFDRRAIEETLDPRRDRNIELDPAAVDKQGDLPGADRTQVDRPASEPARIDCAS
jgi:hypothetical protein